MERRPVLMPLNDKIALVTGGTGALGSVIAQRLHSEGCSVVATTSHTKDSNSNSNAPGDHFKVLAVDITDDFEAMQLYDRIIGDFARVDIVVNTVGGFLPRKFLTEVTVEDWELMMNTNLKSTFLSTREALRRMKGQAYGRIINISAMVGLNPSPGRAPYAISKAGVSMLTEIVSQEVRGTGITINAIAPSIIATPANLSSMPGEDSAKWVTPEQIAGIVCYLCSPEAGAITGTTIKAYGGL